MKEIKKKNIFARYRDFRNMQRVCLPNEGDFFSFLKHYRLFLYNRRKFKFMKQEDFEYKLYEMDDSDKLEYVPGRLYPSRYVRRLNSDEACSITVSKPKINSLFPELLHRDWVDCTTCTQAELEAFLGKHATFIQKPVDGQSGHDVSKRRTEEITDTAQALAWWRKEGFMLEEIIVEDPTLAAYNPDSLNTIRVCTIRNKDGNYDIINAAFRIGRKGKCVDNFDGGGIAAKIDFDSGEVVAAAVNGMGQRFERHPDSGIPSIGAMIPKWDEIKDTAVRSAQKLPGRCVAWDFCVNSNGEVTLIEANSAPSIDFMQLVEGYGFASLLDRYVAEQ